MNHHSSLVQPLFSGDIDVIGDIHGEIGALYSLLDRLGYNADGVHKQGRKLVFVGDLVDRGPDSVAVCSLLKDMWEKENAQIVMGNHELNILRRKVETYNAWYHGSDHLKSAHLIKDTHNHKIKEHVSLQRGYPPYTSDWIRDFFMQLPVALERENIRVVHSCWDQDAVNALRTGEQNPLKRYLLEEEHCIATFTPSYSDAKRQKAERDLHKQNNNPVKLLTSGPEYMGKEFIVHGNARLTHRKKWWEEYKDKPKVIFGHYWRRRSKKCKDVRTAPPPYLFNGIKKYAWLGNTFCIDYSVGARYMERAASKKQGTFSSYLCALRVFGNSYELLFDDGLHKHI